MTQTHLNSLSDMDDDFQDAFREVEVARMNFRRAQSNVAHARDALMKAERHSDRLLNKFMANPKGNKFS